MQSNSATHYSKDSRNTTKTARRVTASFAKGLFHGRILSNVIFPFPDLRHEEQEILNMTVTAIDKMSRDIAVERFEDERRIPPEILDRLKKMGMFGLIIPEQFGGFGVSTATYVQILSSLGILDPAITVTLGAHQSIGLKALLMFGNSRQQQQFLPQLASGGMIAGFALTEPGAGSDARSLKTTAELSEDGSCYILNGNKIWITNGGIADFFTVFARTFHPDPNGGRKEKITCFIVTRDMKGFSNGPEEKKMGLLASSTTSLHFENVRVPVENVIGEPGNGFKIAMEVLNNGRLGLACACALATKKLNQMAMEHAIERKQFGKRLADFGLIQSKIANMAIDNFVAESMVRMTAHLMDQGGYDYSLETAICKVFCTEIEWRAVNEALQTAGGSGYMKEYGYEKILRDSRIFMIWEGANEILRLFVGLGGLQGPGEQLKEIAQTLKKPLNDVLKSFGVLSDFGVRWIQRRVTTPEKLKGIHPALAAEAATFEKYTTLFSAEAERSLLRLGKAIIHDEFTVRRFADIAIDLYAMVCTLSRVSKIIEEKGAEHSKFEIAIARTFTRKARRRMAENMRRLDKNDDALEVFVAETLYERGGYATHGVFSLP